jgi:MSHA biogenesis protein MshK
MQIKNTLKISNTLLWLVLIILALTLVTNVNAEALRDPTQIPNDLPVSASQRYMARTITTGPALQSIMLSSDIKAAIISGKKINLGERFEGAKLINLTESSATLRNKNGSKTVLNMNAGIVKKNSEITVRVSKN